MMFNILAHIRPPVALHHSIIAHHAVSIAGDVVLYAVGIPAVISLSLILDHHPL